MFLIILLVLYGAVSLITPSKTIRKQLPLLVANSEGYSPTNPPPPPAITRQELEAIRNGSGFQGFISYTDRGFEPTSVSIKKGQTVRFTNNSNTGMWISSIVTDASAPYPGTGNDCGNSAFDSCRTLNPGEFFEFTFDTVGTWGFNNIVKANDRGLIHVK